MMPLYQHPDDLDGLDAYDRMLASDMDYSRPIYGDARQYPDDTTDGVTERTPTPGTEVISS